MDADGQPVLDRMHLWGSGGLHERRFFLREADTWEELHFDALKKGPALQHLCRLEVENGLPVSAAWFSGHQKGFEDYTHNGDRLVRVDGSWSNTPFGAQNLLAAHWDLEYDDEGRLQPDPHRLPPDRRPFGGIYTAFKRRSKKGVRRGVLSVKVPDPLGPVAGSTSRPNA